MPAPIPPLLDAYIKVPAAGSLLLATSVLDATSNWLLLRYLYAAIHGAKAKPTGSYGDVTTDSFQAQTNQRHKVVFISFLRSFEFWKNEGKRLGLDLPSLIEQKRLHYIDGLSNLFLPSTKAYPTPQKGVQPSKLTFTSLDDLESTVASQIAAFAGPSASENGQDGNTLVIMDAPDVLLAATAGAEMAPAGKSQSTGASGLAKLCLSLRSLPSVHSMIVAVSADGPLIHHDSTPTPLETDHKTFVVTLSHQSKLVLQLRPLDTGRAIDVSGVIRVNRGGAWEHEEESHGELLVSITSRKVPADVDGEWLYHIAGNGEAKVWGRGEAGLG